jgi:hypothetical protein
MVFNTVWKQNATIMKYAVKRQRITFSAQDNSICFAGMKIGKGSGAPI